MRVIIIVLATFVAFSNTQTVSNIHLVGHIPYMINFLQEVVFELERREWCNLKVPDITVTLNETVLDKQYEGTVTYSNGFVASMQWVDIRQDGVSQVWSMNSTDGSGTVRLRAPLRMLDLALGYDVVADLTVGRRRSTVTVTYPLNMFTFNIWKNVNTEDVRVEVEGSVTLATLNTVKFLPNDEITDVLHTLFDVRLPQAGILTWTENVLPSIGLEAYKKVEFPRICYHCTLASQL